MHRFLLVAAAPLAALVLSAAPAGAQSFAPKPGVSADFGVSVHRDGKRHDRRRHRGDFDTVFVVGSSEGWTFYNNRTFQSDSYNDWWHDRPDRAFPRWMQSNQNCDRVWWGGGVWRC